MSQVSCINLLFVAAYFCFREYSSPIEDGFSFKHIFYRLSESLAKDVVMLRGTNDDSSFSFTEDQANSIVTTIDVVSSELILTILSFLDINSLRQSCIVCREWNRVGSSNSLWRSYCEAALRRRYLAEFSRSQEGISISKVIIRLIFEASKHYPKFVHHRSNTCTNVKSFTLKQFLATTKCCEFETKGTAGRWIVIGGDEIRPHHIFRLFRVLAMKKQPEYALEIFSKFSSYLSKLYDNGGNISRGVLVGNYHQLGYIFGGQVSCSVAEFVSIVESVDGLKLPEVLTYFSKIDFEQSVTF
mmetsp:Transcript_7536/g.9075  ORF Transcript_7536/g.9075 Transcript_7536/m.9075 type:complete len:300 (-) Transcript_7536:440-1339(-)